jgi:hypothetical protein
VHDFQIDFLAAMAAPPFLFDLSITGMPGSYQLYISHSAFMPNLGCLMNGRRGFMYLDLQYMYVSTYDDSIPAMPANFGVSVLLSFRRVLPKLQLFTEKRSMISTGCWQEKDSLFVRSDFFGCHLKFLCDTMGHEHLPPNNRKISQLGHQIGPWFFYVQN